MPGHGDMMRRIVIASALLLAGAGCSRLDFSDPFSFPSMGRRPKPRKSPTAVETADARTERLAEVLSKWNETFGKALADEDYLVGAGDEVDVSIYALETPDTTTHLKRTISRDGMLNLPWVGDIPTAGLTVRQLEAAVRQAYAGRYIRNPQITLEITEHRSAAVVVTGAVKNPGIYYLASTRSTILEMLLKAGGLSPEAADEVLVIRPPKDTAPAATNGQEAVQAAVTNEDPAVSAAATNDDLTARATAAALAVAQGGTTKSIDLGQLIDSSDPAANIEVGPGDVIAVRSRAQRYFYVLGYVARPGAYAISSPQLDPVHAVALAGGLTPMARADHSFILRETAQGQTVIPLNLNKAVRGVATPTYIEGGDTLVIGTSFMGRLSEFVRPSAAFGVSAQYAPLAAP